MNARAGSNPRRYEAMARVAKALAHPGRLMMLEALAEKERCVCELAELVGADPSTVSRHLALLKQLGLVADRRVGAMTLCRLRSACLPKLWDGLESVLLDNLAAQEEAIDS